MDGAVDGLIDVVVTRRRDEAEGIVGLELAAADGTPLPAFDAGAHVDLHLPAALGGWVRPYSLCGDPADPARYRLAVLREPASRGGSAAVQAQLHAGVALRIGRPRQHFPLSPDARRHLLLAGGIGMTPLLAMAQALARQGADFELCCFARSREHLAFAEALREPALAPHVRLHFDHPSEPQKIDLGRLLAEPAAGTHLYVCGPAGFMQAVRAAAAQWPEEAVHTEYFAPPASSDAGEDSPFELVLARRGITVPVAAGQSAVGALHELGLDIPTSCEQGLCGTCVVDLLDGEAEHRDHCLSSAERRHRLALCCSRARSPRLVLDL